MSSSLVHERERPSQDMSAADGELEQTLAEGGTSAATRPATPVFLWEVPDELLSFEQGLEETDDIVADEDTRSQTELQKIDEFVDTYLQEFFPTEPEEGWVPMPIPQALNPVVEQPSPVVRPYPQHYSDRVQHDTDAGIFPPGPPPATAFGGFNNFSLPAEPFTYVGGSSSMTPAPPAAPFSTAPYPHSQTAGEALYKPKAQSEVCQACNGSGMVWTYKQSAPENFEAPFPNAFSALPRSANPFDSE